MTTPSPARRLALVADDDPGQRILMQEALSQAGFDVIAVADGAAAVEQAGARRPDIIFLDLMMPVRTGLEACRAIRSMLGSACPPLIVVTSRDTDDSVTEGLAAGATDYLIKPVNLTLLRHRARGWLAAHEAAARQPAAASERRITVSRRGAVLRDSEGAGGRADGADIELSALLPATLASQVMVCVRKVLKTREPTRCSCAGWEASVTAEGREQALVVLRSTDAQASDSAELYRLAYHDTLTGLPNRHLFERTAKACLSDALLKGTGVTLICLTFDRLANADREATQSSVLRKLADQLVRTLRDSDSVVHYEQSTESGSPLASVDGTHFLVLLGETAGRDSQQAVVERIRKACALATRGGPATVQFVPRIGIAQYPENADSLDLLIEKAMRAAGEAREHRDANPRRAGAELASIELRADLAAELRYALDHGQFCLHFQPRVDLQTQRVAGAEALLRWQHPLRGTIAANVLIGMAEKAGEMARLADWALEQACRQARAWADRLAAPVRISVNTTEAQLARHDFSARLVAMLGELGLDPARIDVEVPECGLDRSKDVIAQLLALRDAGVGLIVDDFGTGRSSLASLRRLRIDGFKVDHNHIRSAALSAEDTGVYALAASIARVRHACVIAKGIETAQELAFARARGCDQVQGFFICQPLPVEQFEKYVAGAMHGVGLPLPVAVA